MEVGTMEQETFSKWLKTIIIGTGICGAVVYIFVFPEYGKSLVYDYPEYSYCYWPWLIFLWITGIPCYGVLILAWNIASNIGKNLSFSMQNAKLMKDISFLAAVDSGFFFIGNLVYLFLNINHPGIVLLAMIVVFFGIAVAVAAAALSHLIMKAAQLQEQSDLTI